MMKARAPEEETQITRKQIGYSWGFSYEHGAAGSRQKVSLTGHTEGLNRALTELRKAKVEAYKIALASAEELSRPPPYEAYTDRDREDAGEGLLF